MCTADRLLWLLLISLLARSRAQNTVGTSTTPEGLDFLEENGKKPGVRQVNFTADSYIQYRVLVNGTGAASPALATPVVVNYTGSFINGTVFDSNVISIEPRQVIVGWGIALQLMVEGDVWEVYIPSELAYGSEGRLGIIPPGAVLIFRMELVDVPLCQMCASDQMLWNEDLTIPGTTDNLTCASVDELAQRVPAASDLCGSIQGNRRACCQGASTCSLCPNEGTPSNRSLVFPGAAIQLSNCGQYWFASYYFNEPQCLNGLSAGETSVGFDFAAYCECPNTTIPEGLCGSSMCDNPDDFVRGDLEILPGMSCAQAQDYLLYFLDAVQCEFFRANFQPVCCQGVSNCTLCEGDVEPAFRDRSVPFDGTDCDGVRAGVYLEDECSVVETLRNSTVDLPAYCGCPNVTSVADGCTCPGSSAFTASMTLPDGTLCESLVDFLPFLWSTTGECATTVESCCVDQTVPTPAPTSSPVFDTSAAFSRPIGWMACAAASSLLVL